MSSETYGNPFPQKKRQSGWFLLPAILLLALGLRLCNITATSLWLDEIYSFMVGNVHLPPGRLHVSVQTASDYYRHYLAWQPMNLDALIAWLKVNVHLPLYYLLLNPWLGGVGNTEFGLRSFSTVFSMLMLLPLYSLGKAMGGRRAGLLAAFVAAVTPFLLYFAQEGRMYTLSLFWATLSALGLWKTLYAKKPLGWSLLYAIAVAGGALSHYMFYLFLGFQAIYALVWLIRFRDFKRFALFGFALATLLTVLAWWYPIYQIQQQGIDEEYHFAKGLKNIMRYVTSLVWQPLVVVAGDNRWERLFYMPLTAILFLLYLFKPGKCKEQDLPQCEGFSLEREGFLISWIFLPLFIQIAYDFVKQTHTVVIDRYIILITPGVLLWFALSLERLCRMGQKRVVAILAGLMLLLAVANVWNPSPFRDEHNKKDTRGRIAYMVNHARPDDLVFVNGPFGSPNLAAWYLVKSRPNQPILYWISEYHRQPVALPSRDLFKSYQRVWFFRNRSTNERGLQTAKDYLQSMYPHVQEHDIWFIYSR